MQALRLTLASRALRDHDLPLIAAWVQGPAELAALLPQASWPLTPERLAAGLRMHRYATVLLHQGEPLALASLARAELYGSCRLGCVLVRADRRGQGLGRQLVELMREQARQRYHARDLRAVCLNADTPSLLFLTRLGFEPTVIEARPQASGLAAFVHLRQPLIPLA